MIRLTLEPEPGGMAALRCGYNEAAIAQFKTMPGCQWDPHRRVWTAPAEAAVILAKRLERARIARVKTDNDLTFTEEIDYEQYRSTALSSDIYNYQFAGARFLCSRIQELGAAILADDMGLGKAQPKNSKVLTPTGWRPIGSLVVGDEVIGRNGSATQVTGVFPQGERKIFKVRTQDDRVTRCCSEHLWAYQTALDRNRRPDHFRTSQLSDIGALKDKNGNRQRFLPVNSPIYFPRVKLPVHPYLLGALIANGHLRGTPQHIGGEDQRTKLEPFLPKGVRIVMSGRSKTTCRLGSGKPGVKGGNALINGLRELGLFELRSWEKFIPEEYLQSSIEQRCQLLCGLVDNDGTVSADGYVVEYNTTSTQLAGGVVELIRSLGGVARVSTRIPYYSYRGERLAGRLDHRIRISLPPNIVPVSLPRKLARFKPKTKYPPCVAIDSVEEDGKAECVCIQVAAKDQLYITDDYIVTHNSNQALRAIEWLDHPEYDSQVLILCPAIVVGHWQDEIKKWTDAESTRLSKDCNDWPGITFGVVSYDTFRSLSKQKGKPIGVADIVVLDELHYLSNSKSQRSKAVAAYLKRCKPKAIIGLSGTPMTVRPRDLWHPLQLLWPDRFGSFFRFAQRYCDGHYETIPGVAREVWQCDGASNIEELGERLKPLMLRRTRSEVLELPDRQRIVIGVDLPKKAQKSLGKALADVKDGDSVQKVLGAAEEHKLNAAIELTEDLVAQGHRPLVLTTRRKTAHKLGEELDCPAVTGEDPPGNRRSCLLSGGGAAVATIYSVTTGINLTEFDSAIFVGLDWVPSTLLQAEARLHRIGQKKSVVYYYLIGLGSIDEVVRSRIIERLDHFITLIGGENSDQADLADALDDSSEDLITQIVSMVKEMHT